MKKVILGFFAVVVMATVSSCNSSASANNTKTGGDPVDTMHPPVSAGGDTFVKPVAVSDDTSGAPRRLTFGDCPYSVKIVQGNAFVFPADLNEFGLEYVRQGDGYVLRTTGDLVQVASISVSFSDTSSDPHISIRGNAPNTDLTVHKGAKGNTVTFYHSGTSLAQSDTGTIQAYISSKGISKEIVITVPAHTSIGGNVTGAVRIEAVFDTLNLKASGNANVYVDSGRIVQNLQTVGSSQATVRAADTLWSVSAKESSTVTASLVKIGTKSESNQGKVRNPAK